MRKPTRSEAFFLATILTVATLATVEITPRLIESCKTTMAARKSKKNTKSVFYDGLIIGIGGGVLGTKLAMDRLARY